MRKILLNVICRFPTLLRIQSSPDSSPSTTARRGASTRISPIVQFNHEGIYNHKVTRRLNFFILAVWPLIRTTSSVLNHRMYPLMRGKLYGRLNVLIMRNLLTLQNLMQKFAIYNHLGNGRSDQLKNFG